MGPGWSSLRQGLWAPLLLCQLALASALSGTCPQTGGWTPDAGGGECAGVRSGCVAASTVFQELYSYGGQDTLCCRCATTTAQRPLAACPYGWTAGDVQAADNPCAQLSQTECRQPGLQLFSEVFEPPYCCTCSAREAAEPSNDAGAADALDALPSPPAVQLESGQWPLTSQQTTCIRQAAAGSQEFAQYAFLSAVVGTLALHGQGNETDALAALPDAQQLGTASALQAVAAYQTWVAAALRGCGAPPVFQFGNSSAEPLQALLWLASIGDGSSLLLSTGQQSAGGSVAASSAAAAVTTRRLLFFEGLSGKLPAVATGLGFGLMGDILAARVVESAAVLDPAADGPAGAAAGTGAGLAAGAIAAYYAAGNGQGSGLQQQLQASGESALDACEEGSPLAALLAAAAQSQQVGAATAAARQLADDLAPLNSKLSYYRQYVLQYIGSAVADQAKRAQQYADTVLPDLYRQAMAAQQRTLGTLASLLLGDGTTALAPTVEGVGELLGDAGRGGPQGPMPPTSDAVPSMLASPPPAVPASPGAFPGNADQCISAFNDKVAPVCFTDADLAPCCAAHSALGPDCLSYLATTFALESDQKWYTALKNTLYQCGIPMPTTARDAEPPVPQSSSASLRS